MKAVAINDFGGRDKLQAMNLPTPEPGEGEVLIDVRAAGVNPVDWKIREGHLKEAFPHEFPLIPGWEAAGVLVGKGPGVDRLKEGDEVFVYARKPVVRDGAYAEYLVVDAAHVARMPAHMSFSEAATVPLAGLTAYQALYDAADLKDGETVLIHAAAGGVGTFAVQLARARGAATLGTASERHRAYLQAIGLDAQIDYTEIDFREAVREVTDGGVDVVLDAVGGDVLRHSAEILKPGGRLVSIVDPEGVAQLQQQGIDAHWVFVEPNRAQLEELARMVDTGKLRTYISARFPLANAAAAHEHIEDGHTEGKLVLMIKD